jgi:hypothetical protein
MRQKNSVVRLPRILRQSTKHFKSKIMYRFFPCAKLIYERGLERVRRPPRLFLTPRPGIFRPVSCLRAAREPPRAGKLTSCASTRLRAYFCPSKGFLLSRI